MSTFNTEQLEDLRKARGLTKTDFARLIGVSRQSYSSWLRGRVKPNVRAIERLAKAFGVDSGSFFVLK